jgi:hypothetical protein
MMPLSPFSLFAIDIFATSIIFRCCCFDTIAAIFFRHAFHCSRRRHALRRQPPLRHIDAIISRWLIRCFSPLFIAIAAAFDITPLFITLIIIAFTPLIAAIIFATPHYYASAAAADAAAVSRCRRQLPLDCRRCC